MKPAVLCSKCKHRLTPDAWNASRYERCPACDRPVRVSVYPALFRRTGPGTPGQPLVLDDDASCFYHPAKQAVVPCAVCGRFLCALCDLELKGQHLCPVCLSVGQQKGRLKSVENRRIAHDNVALALAVLSPLLLWPLTCFTAPAAIYVALRYWNAPQGPIPRSKLRLILALLFAALQVAGWAIVVTLLVSGKLK